VGRGGIYGSCRRGVAFRVLLDRGAGRGGGDGRCERRVVVAPCRFSPRVWLRFRCDFPARLVTGAATLSGAAGMAWGQGGRRPGGREMSQVEERGSELVAICGVAVVRCTPVGMVWGPGCFGVYVLLPR
jgi:hypothetical protein